MPLDLIHEVAAEAGEVLTDLRFGADVIREAEQEIVAELAVLAVDAGEVAVSLEDIEVAEAVIVGDEAAHREPGVGAAAEVVHHAVELVVELDDLVHRVLDVVEQGILLPHALHQLLDLAAADLSGHVPEQCTLEQKTGRVALLDERRVDAADPGSALRKNIDQPVAL